MVCFRPDITGLYSIPYIFLNNQLFFIAQVSIGHIPFTMADYNLVGITSEPCGDYNQLVDP